MTIDEIIAGMPRPVYTEVNDLTLNLWIKRAISLLPNIVKYTTKIKYLELVDGKCELPSDLKVINAVHWQHDEPTQSSLYDVGCQSCEPYEVRTHICKPMVYYRIFLNSSMYNTYFLPLKYIGKDKSLICSNCVNLQSHCSETFVVKNGMLYASINSGWLCVEYETIDCEDGIIHLPDMPILVDYVKAFVLKTLWEEKVLLNESGAAQMFDRYKQEYDLLYRKVRGSAFLRNTNLNNLELTKTGQYGLLRKWMS